MTPEQEAIKLAIMAAPDHAVAKVTEPVSKVCAAAPDGTRDTRRDHSSVTVQVGKVYRETIEYMNPALSDSFGAVREITEEIIG